MAIEDRHQRVTDIQTALRRAAGSTGLAGLDGWLFYDFRHSDSIAYRILLLDPAQHVTRRWYYWVPADGQPVKLSHRIEPHVLDALPGKTLTYVSWQEQHDRLRSMLPRGARVAMQYSPMNAIPYVARVDAGTVELIRSIGVEPVTSADLVQQFEAVWNQEQLAAHRAAAKVLRLVVDETFREVAEAVTRGQELTEYQLQQFMLGRFQYHGVVTSSPPIVAVNAHSADPHYGPSAASSMPISKGDLLLIDLWAKAPAAGSVYADITWTGFVGPKVPSRQQEVFHIVRLARDTALQFVRRRIRSDDWPCGWEVDDVCRMVINEAGYGEQFVHRTGHSIGEEVHGNGANIDNLETRDLRRLLNHTCFSIEPGIYLPGDFGIRSELDVYLDGRDALVFGLPLQTEIIPILGL